MPSKRQRQRRKERNELERESERESAAKAEREAISRGEGSKEFKEAPAVGLRRKDARKQAGKRAEDDGGVDSGEKRSEGELLQGVVAGPKMKQAMAQEGAIVEVLREHNFEEEVEDPSVMSLIREAAEMKMKRIDEARKKRERRRERRRCRFGEAPMPK